MAPDAHAGAALVHSIRSQPAAYTNEMCAAIRRSSKLLKLTMDDSTYQLTPRSWPTSQEPRLEDITPQHPKALSPFPLLKHLDLTRLPTTSSAAADMLQLLRWLAPISTTNPPQPGGSCLTTLAVPIHVTPSSHKVAMLQHIAGLGRLTSLILSGATTSRSVFAVPVLHLASGDLQLLSSSLPGLHTLNLTDVHADFDEVLDLFSVKELSLTCCTSRDSSASVPPSAPAQGVTPTSVDQEEVFEAQGSSSRGGGVGGGSSSSSSSRGGVGGSSSSLSQKQGFAPLRLASLHVRRCHLMPAIRRAVQQGATCLRHVQLQQCGLRSMPQELLELTALVTLDLSHNSLTVLPPQTFHTWSTSGSLQRLDLSHNQLVQLPEELCQVTSLQELLLHHNDLQLLPAKVGQLGCLRLLDVHANPHLRQLPRGLLLAPLSQQLQLVVDGHKTCSRLQTSSHGAGAGWCSELGDRFGERLVTKACMPQGVCC